jgi:DNA-binding NarL/FixJ family response regulator
MSTSAPVREVSILLVEDHDEYREGLRSVLNMTPGFRCTAVRDAQTALAITEEASFDVVIMDLNLPGMDGSACTRVIKQRWPDCQVMVCTVFDDAGKIFEALKAGATGYVLKRAPVQEIIDGVHVLLQGGSPMSAGIARKVVGSFQQASPAVQAGLSEREHEVLQLLARGQTIKEIAAELFISTATVKTHVHHIYRKLQVQNRVELLNRTRS